MTYSASMEPKWLKDTKQVSAWRTQSVMKVRSEKGIQLWEEINFSLLKHVAENKFLYVQ